MALSHRGVAAFDELTDRRVEISINERALIFRLDMIFAAPDLGDDGAIVARTGQFVAEAKEGAVRRGENRAVVLGVAAKLAHFRLKIRDDLLALARPSVLRGKGKGRQLTHIQP